MFDAEQFINNWSESYDWQEELRNGDATVEEIMENLRELEEDYEAHGYRDEEAEPIDWDKVESTLRKYVA